jgi:ACS family glucarate transporter-like MFS transporter
MKSMANLAHGRTRWFLIAWLFVLSAIGYLNRVNISVSGEYISQEFHLSQIQLGWVFSVFTLGYALFQAPTGRLADRFGPRRVLALATIWWAVILGLTAVAPSGISGALILLLALRFALGMGVASIYPSSNRVVASWIPSAERGVANGWIFAGVGAGAGIAPPLITYLLLHGGWRWSFWVCAAIGLAAGLVWYLLARDRPEQHSWMTPREAEHIRSGLPRVPSGPSALKAVPWGTILGSKEVLLVSLSYFSFSYSANIFFTWFFPYLKTVRHLDLQSSAFFGMLPFLAMATCSPLGGWISDVLTKHYGRRTGRCGIPVACMGLSALFIALGTLVADARLASIVLAAGAGALYLSQSSYWSVTADIAGPSAGTVSGVMNMLGQFGGVVAPSLTPLLAKHFGWPAAFLVAAGLGVMGSLVWLAVNPERTLLREPVVKSEKRI